MIPGTPFGLWTVQVGDPVRRGRHTLWPCKCECGTERYVLEDNLASSASTSCGCKPRRDSEDTRPRVAFNLVTMDGPTR